MIKVKNKFNDSILEITFSKESETKKEISIPVATDVNFKMLVDYLLETVNDDLPF